MSRLAVVALGVLVLAGPPLAAQEPEPGLMGEGALNFFTGGHGTGSGGMRLSMRWILSQMILPQPGTCSVSHSVPRMKGWPVARILAEELGATGTFLASDGAAAITGQVIYVDCGYQIMGM